MSKAINKRTADKAGLETRANEKSNKNIRLAFLKLFMITKLI
jgi:hypothetical protein